MTIVILLCLFLVLNRIVKNAATAFAVTDF